MKNLTSKVRGFTLIEMLVVIAIIALLTGIVITNLSSSKAKARDVKRISDMGNLQLALSLYYDRCKQYPTGASPMLLTDNQGCPPGITLGSFISVIPTPPTAGTEYGYVRFYVVGNVVDYFLRIDLEGYNEVLKDDLDGNVFPNVADPNYCGAPQNGEGTAELRYCIGSR